MALHFFPNTVTTSRGGTLTFQVNWTSAANRMTAVIATSTCSIEAYQNYNCSLLVQDALPTATPTKTVKATNLAAGSYVIIIDNEGPGDESFNYVVTLTPDS